MDVSTRTSERRIIEVDGHEFYVDELVQPLSWLKHGDVEDHHVNTQVLRKMKAAGLVRKVTSGGLMSLDDDDPTVKWEQVDGKCRELFEELNEPYHRLRPKIDNSETPMAFGMWDEQEDEDARAKAEQKVKELNERNPDVTFRLDEEELSHIRT